MNYVKLRCRKCGVTFIDQGTTKQMAAKYKQWQGLIKLPVGSDISNYVGNTVIVKS